MFELSELLGIPMWMWILLVLLCGIVSAIDIQKKWEEKSRKKSKNSFAFLLSHIYDLEKIENSNFNGKTDHSNVIKESLAQLSISDLKYLQKILTEIKDEKLSTMLTQIDGIIVNLIQNKKTDA